ncbi:hypothetical protein SLS58_006826 [Diplodia intermedia]|uniref:Uncharacterized protein n=1 Tax=Diplodia intermedia TaxID=856260 RepID=A0ABR3TM93_9PEZI
MRAPPTSGASTFLILLAAGRLPSVELTSPARSVQLSTSVSAADPPPQAHETHERYEPYTTSLQQRQQQAHQYYRQHEPLSRPSSSSGSIPHTLRRTPELQDLNRQATASAPRDTAQEHWESAREAANSRRNSATEDDPDDPHPALRISRRTQAAILYALEEALRGPNQFSPDLAEENAQMSDLLGGNGRAANGGARSAAGPVPVQQAPTTMRTPQQIMRARHERETARKQAEAEAAKEREEQVQRAQQEEQRRKNAERRAAAAGVAGQTQDYGRTELAPGRTSAEATFPNYTTAAPGPGERPQGGAGGPVMSPGRGQPQDPAAAARSRGPALSQGQPRAAPPQTAPASTPARPAQSAAAHARQNSSSASQARQAASAGPSSTQTRVAGDGQARDPTVSTFPHAFERWEQLSSHWEGLTSYWIRRLEQNQEELAGQSLTQQMSRQITDLSAAGANLFHAVVELQRLRASSERKFQRWFYETRSEQERQQEGLGELRKAIEVERAAREEALEQLRGEKQKSMKANKMVQEMQRELSISKDEARRAWEELGRREQEERERVVSLREGQPTLVGGVQVVPMIPGMSRHGSISQNVAPGGGHGHQQPTNIEGGYSYEDPQSPTDTDPFTEPSRLHREPDVPSLAQGTYQPAQPNVSQGPSSAAARAAMPTNMSPAPLQPHTYTPGSTAAGLPSPTAAPAGDFYQHDGSFLPGGRTPTSGVMSPPGGERSYVPSSVGDTSSIGGEDDWLVDQDGNYIHDNHGRRIPARYRESGATYGHGRSRSQQSGEGSEDDYDVHSDIAREQELAQRYGIPSTSMGSPSGTSTSGPHDPGYGPSVSSPDYSGAGYGEWAGMRHHHPTRLSDVLEEDERSRTSASRASQASRGMW